MKENSLEERFNKIEKEYNEMKKDNKKTKKQLGITLVALVITIIVLLILAGITVAQLTGSGLFDRAKVSKQKYKDAQGLENEILSQYENATLNSGVVSTRDGETPAGTLIAFAADNAPSGYLACNGQEVSRTTYAKLFAVIGTKYGAGDGSTTFKVPDLQGEFLRGAGTNSHTNQGSGATVGTHQDGTEMTHTFSDWRTNVDVQTSAYPDNNHDRNHNFDSEITSPGGVWVTGNKSTGNLYK